MAILLDPHPDIKKFWIFQFVKKSVRLKISFMVAHEILARK
jgi:hypothetical protein